MYKKIIIIYLISLFVPSLIAQTSKKIIDNIVAVVGDEIILQSEIEQQYLQAKSQGFQGTESYIRCLLFEEMLMQKLLLKQAEIDSIYVTNEQVETQLNQRVEAMSSQIGSKEKLEAYFNKSILEIKEELRDDLREQMITQKVENELTGSIKITPSEVSDFYARQKSDSLPFIEERFEVNQIVIYPKLNEQALFDVRERLLQMRKRIIDGEKFSMLAALYSEDIASATKGGEIGYLSKGELAAPYADAAFKLKSGGVSGIVETEFGYHIIQLIDKKDNKLNTRHILMRPNYNPGLLRASKIRLDSIANIVRLNDSMSFDKVAKRFTEDVDERKSGGRKINPVNGTYQFAKEDFAADDLYVLKDMKKFDISDVYESKDKNGKKIYKVIYLRNVIEPHYANIKDDYDIIKQLAEAEKKHLIINKWMKEAQSVASIRIDDQYNTCKFESKGWIKE